MSLLCAPAHPSCTRSSIAPSGFVPHERLANSGSPMSRTRSEHIASTLLGRDDGAIRCPRSLRLGLAFARRADPVKTMETLLRSNGYASAEDLRDVFALPGSRLICRPLEPNAPRLADRKSTRLNSSHVKISYAVFCLKKKKKKQYVLIFLKKKKNTTINI